MLGVWAGRPKQLDPRGAGSAGHPSLSSVSPHGLPTWLLGVATSHSVVTCSQPTCPGEPAEGMGATGTQPQKAKVEGEGPLPPYLAGKREKELVSI